MIKNNNAVIFWWPDSVFEDVHWKKDPGSIPLELKNLGYKVILVVGRFHSHVRINGVTVFETQQRETIRSIYNRLISAILLMKLVYLHSPKAIIVEHATFEGIIFAIFLKIYFVKKKKEIPKLILKLDANPEDARVNNETSTGLIYTWLFSILFDNVICESICAYNELLRPAPVSKYNKKYLVIPNGFNNNIQKESIAEKSERRKRILSVGRISYQKGHDLLIHIFAKIKDKYPDWELRIVGLSDDHDYLENLKKEMTDLKLGDSVKVFTDLTDEEIIREYEGASVFCLLSRWESFGISRIEAIHYGLPIVITEAGCGIEYSNFGSLVCNIEDQNCISNALETLISNEDLRGEISEKQKSAILTWHEVAVKFATAIETK